MATDLERQLIAVLHDTAAQINPAVPEPEGVRARAASRPMVRVPRARRWIPIFAAAAVVAGIAVTVALIERPPSQTPVTPGHPATSTASAPPAHTSPPHPSSGSSSHSSAPAHAANCTAAQLAPSIDQTRTGPTNGTENVVILLRNTGLSSCWLGGLPRLSAVTPGGAVVPLRFQASADPAYADPSPAAGPGQVAPGGVGALHLTVGLPPGCTRQSPAYTKLQIELQPGQTMTMPFPRQLAVSGCLGYEAQPGPVVSS